MSDLESRDVITNVITSIFDKDMAIIILGYYFLISEEFKKELNNVMNDRLNRKLRYLEFKSFGTFFIMSKIFDNVLVIDFDKLFDKTNGYYKIQFVYHINSNFSRNMLKSENLPKKSFNKLTKKEISLIIS